MKSTWGALLIPLACMAMAGCKFGVKDKAPKAPTGQVVATVDGDEITARELSAELAGMTFPDAQSRKAGERAALQGIINRKLLAQAAIKAELDKTPDFALQKARANEALLADALQKKIVAEIPPPTREEASGYVTAHPDIFGERKIFEVDQIRMARPTDPSTIKDLEPLQTMSEIEQALSAKGIEFRKGEGTIDAAKVDPRLVAEIVKLPPGEVFVVPDGNTVLINHIRQTRIEPFTGEAAIKHALDVIKRQRTQETLARQFGAIVNAVAGKVQIAKAYQQAKPPPAAPNAAPPPAPAAQPAPAKAT